MSAPAFVNAGAGADGTTSTATAAAPSITIGDLLIMQLAIRNSTITASPPSGWGLIRGPVAGASTTTRTYYFGRKAQSGDSSASFSSTLSAAPNMWMARIYNFGQNWVGDTSTWSNNFEGVADGTATIGTIPSITTTGIDRLAVAFITDSDNDTVASPTGETGGDYTLVTAAYLTTTGLNGGIACASSAKATAGTISGGAFVLQHNNGSSETVFGILPLSTGSTVTFSSSPAATTTVTTTFARTRNVASATAGTAAIVDAFVRTRGLAASPAGHTALVGNFIRQRVFLASPAGGSAVTSILGRIRTLASAPAGTSTVTAAVVRIKLLATGVAGAGAIIVGNVRTRAITAAPSGVTTVSAQSTRTRVMRATPAGTTTVTEALAVTRRFLASDAGVATLVVTPAPRRNLTTTVVGAGRVTGTLKRTAGFSASMALATSVSALDVLSRRFAVAIAKAGAVSADVNTGGSQVFATTPAGTTAIVAPLKLATRAFSTAQAGGSVVQSAFVRSKRVFVAGPAGSAVIDASRGDAHTIIEGVPMIGLNLTPAGPTSATGLYKATGMDGFDVVAVVMNRTAIGGGPAISWTVQGSVDGVTWQDLAYVTPDSTVAASKAAQTTATVSQTVLFIDGLDKRRFEWLAINVASDTNVTFTAQLLVEDHQ